MRVLPNMKVFVPADAYETRQIVRAAAEVEGPVYIRMVRDDVENIYTDEYEFEIGKASLLREGSDLSIVACGPMVRLAIEASDRLRDEGINARVVNMSTIKPIDTDILLDCAQNTRGIITVEDHSVLGGLGSAVSEVVSETIPTKVCKIGVKDLFGMSGKTEELYEQYGLTEDSIYEKAMQMMEIEPAK